MIEFNLMDNGDEPQPSLKATLNTDQREISIRDTDGVLIAQLFLDYHNGKFQVVVDNMETMDEPLMLVKLFPKFEIKGTA